VYARLLRDALARSGIECTSRWLDEEGFIGDTGDFELDEERIRSVASKDDDDVRAATDGLILISETKGHRVNGGKHVETGLALGLGRKVYVLGRRENIFHWHPLVRVFERYEDLLTHLQET
jgi:hypothetical protein